MKVSFSCLAHRLGVLYYFCKHVVYTCAAMPFFNKVFILFYLAAQLTPITGWLGSYKKCSVLDVWENPNGENLCNLIKTEDPIHRGDRQRKNHQSWFILPANAIQILMLQFCNNYFASVDLYSTPAKQLCETVLWRQHLYRVRRKYSQEVWTGLRATWSPNCLSLYSICLAWEASGRERPWMGQEGTTGDGEAVSRERQQETEGRDCRSEGAPR